MKDIEMLATYNVKGQIQPFRFRLIAEDESLIVIKIDHIFSSDIDRKNETIKFRCSCIINELKKTVDIYFKKYELKWYLKI